MGDAAAVGIAAGKGDAAMADDAGDATKKVEEQVTAGGGGGGGGEEVKGTRVDDDTASADSSPNALTDAGRKVVVGSVSALLASSPPVLRAAVAAISSKLTRLRAAFIACTLAALWRSADDPWRAVWTFTTIAVSYLGLWTIYFTTTTATTIRPLTVLVSLSYLTLLAISVTHVSSSAGVLVMLLATAYAAGLFGYVLAEHRQRKGLDRSAELLRNRVKEEEEEEEGLKKKDNNEAAAITMASLYATVFSVLAAAGAAWVVFFTADMYWVVLLLSLLVDLGIFCWIGVVTVHLLHGVLLEHDHLTLLYWGTALLVLPDFLLTYLFGQAIGMLVHPVGVMGLAAVLGYSISVHVCYKKHIGTSS